MSANKKPKLHLVSSTDQIVKPLSFDPEAVRQRITRAGAAPIESERLVAAYLVLDDAKLMLRLIEIMGGEIVAFRQQIKSLAQQSTDTATINSVLLAHAGGEVRMDGKWFEEYEVTGGFQVTEENGEVVIRLVDEPVDQAVPSVSASQQTEGD